MKLTSLLKTIASTKNGVDRSSLCILLAKSNIFQ